MASLHKSKIADQCSKDLIFGYLKQTQLPQLVKYLTLAYYCIPEYFDNYREYYFKVSNDKTTITTRYNIDFNRHQIFAHQRIASLSNKTYKWKLRVNSKSFWFGITSEPESEQNVESFFGNYKTSLQHTHPYYVIHSMGRTYHGDNTTKRRKSEHRKEITKNIFVSIQTVDLILNLSKGTLSCIINDDQTKKFLAFENVIKGEDIKYSLSVVMYANKRDEISIMSFDRM